MALGESSSVKIPVYMAIQYYFDNLEPTQFQRLINALLVVRFGESIRLLPLRGTDGGRDAETASLNSAFEVDARVPPLLPMRRALKTGRYSFQVKHHRMADRQSTAVRSLVISDFEKELRLNILSRDEKDRPQYFFLVTNVPSSKEAIAKLDEKRKEILADTQDLHADVLWQDHVVAWLDQSPRVWNTFPEIFSGSKVPTLGQVANRSAQGLSRALRLAVTAQARRDGIVRFRQVNFEQSLSKLFVDLDVQASPFRNAGVHFAKDSLQLPFEAPPEVFHFSTGEFGHKFSCIHMLLSEMENVPQRIILEGGPGQGKSTISQMLAQVYRSLLLQNEDEYRRMWKNIPKARFPIRLELRLLAEWLGKLDGSIEQYLSDLFTRDAGGNQISVDDIHSAVEQQPVILIFDGLDEVGSDDLRDSVIQKISECTERFEQDLGADVRVLVTSRPPAIAGRVNRLPGFQRFPILPLSDEKVADYLQRWTAAVCSDAFEQERVVESFNKRKSEQHVQALVKNPMQLSVLLHFIRLKGEAFPDRRAELYREYFKTVIDRDVEKSPHLRQNRETIEALHEVIGFEIHSRAESDRAAASLSHDQLIDIVEGWLRSQGQKPELARELFRTSEERLGLVVALQGEGAATRYGFEVQPVREYFAAAFINDKCESDAHDLFPAMVRRSFWREVALFLAGLRRANEKADLLSRAQALDDDKESGWQSDGRTIVLQLLQEGVLTSPGHVFQDAISFLLDYLDPLKFAPSIEPKGLISALPSLLRSSDRVHSQNELEALLTKTRTNQDEYSLEQLWSVANRALPNSSLIQHWKAYASKSAELESKVKVLWPAEARMGAQAISAKIEMPPAEGAPKWAERLFRAASIDREVTAMDLTGDYHQLLFEQFAFQPFLWQFAGQHDPIKPYAIWRLCTLLRDLTLRLVKTGEPVSAPASEPDLSGLDKATAVSVAKLIDAAQKALKNISRGKNTVRGLSEFMVTLDETLSEDGLVGWIACRCAVVLLQGSSPRYGWGMRFSRRNEPLLRNSEPWYQLKQKLPAFYRSGIAADSDAAGRSAASKILQLDLYKTCPSHVRLNGTLSSVPLLLSQIHNGHAKPPYEWLTRVPIPQYWIIDLLSADPSLNVLRMFAECEISWYGPRVNLNRKVMREIASAVRDSKDKQFLEGALFALIGSKFWNLAGLATLKKIIEADAGLQDTASALFDSRGSVPGEIPSKRQIDLAQLIVRRKITATKRTATAASKFLLDNSAVKLPALKSLSVFPKSTSCKTELQV